jgi:hypothetical protein
MPHGISAVRNARSSAAGVSSSTTRRERTGAVALAGAAQALTVSARSATTAVNKNRDMRPGSLRPHRDERSIVS